MKIDKKNEEVIDEVRNSISEGKIISEIGEKIGINYEDMRLKKEKNLKLTKKENFIQNARDRGVKIISELYKIKRNEIIKRLYKRGETIKFISKNNPLAFYKSWQILSRKRYQSASAQLRLLRYGIASYRAV